MKATPPFTLEDILPILPHRPPFLFVDRVTTLEPHRVIVGERLLRADEPQFAGHFPGRPIMPGVLVAEALAQVSGLLLALSERASGAESPRKSPLYFLASSSFKFTRPAVPGDLLVLRAESETAMAGLFQFRGEARVKENVIATGSLTLAWVGTQ